MACTENEAVNLSITFPYPLPADEAEAIDNYLLAKDLDNLDLPNGAPSLSIVNGYMNLHNGRLLFNHSPNHFTFSLVLPGKAATNI